MNRITSNIKHFALSLLVVGLAFATQAFKNVSAKTENRIDKIYYQLPSGLYTSNPGEGECTEADNPCTLHYTDSAPSQEDFTYENRPSGTVVESDPGVYQ